MLKDILEDEYTKILVSIPHLEGEEWIPLNRDIYPLIKPVYWISSKGRVYNQVTKRILKTRCLDPEKHVSPYYKVNLQIEIMGHSYSCVLLVHRLMMCSFHPIEGMEKLLVNHKDGNKLNDELSNLEWTTPSGNVIHAMKTGLFKPVYGENHCCATINEETALKIIELLLERKLTYKEIAEKVGTTESIVGSIATRKAWKHLTNGIDLSIVKHRLPKDFTFDEINRCCKYFEDNKKPDDMSVRRYCVNCLIAIKYERKITEAVLNSIRMVYQKRRYLHISKNYNF
jgi:DNA-binding transcriptional ArsR family regulator